MIRAKVEGIEFLAATGFASAQTLSGATEVASSAAKLTKVRRGSHPKLAAKPRSKTRQNHRSRRWMIFIRRVLVEHLLGAAPVVSIAGQ